MSDIHKTASVKREALPGGGVYFTLGDIEGSTLGALWHALCRKCRRSTGAYTIREASSADDAELAVCAEMVKHSHECGPQSTWGPMGWGCGNKGLDGKPEHAQGCRCDLT